MSEASEGMDVKIEQMETTQIDKDTEVITHIPMDGATTIDLQNAVVIVPENEASTMGLSTLHDSGVIVVASVTSSGELITPDMESCSIKDSIPHVEETGVSEEAAKDETEDVEEDPDDEGEDIEDEEDLEDEGEDIEILEDEEDDEEAMETKKNLRASRKAAVETKEESEPEPDPEPVDPNTCSYCGKAFKSQTGLKRHLMVCQPEEDEDLDDPLAFEICHCCGEPVDTAHKVGDFPCPKCDKLFVSESAKDRHNRIVHCDGLTCPDCDKKCTSRQQLEKHIIAHMEKPFACTRCNKVFTRKYHLDRHVMQTGCDGKPRQSYKCQTESSDNDDDYQVCDKSFARRDNLREHLRAHAGQVKRKKIFQCTECNKEFHGAGLLAIHMRTHTGEKPFQCTMCPKRFPSSGAMKKHSRMHTGERPYECKECKARFAAKETLNRHVRIHTGHKPHTCQFCGKCFIQASQLRAHIFHHTGENGFTCDHCGKAFNRRARLVTHVKFVHEGAKPFECDTCKKTFVRKEDLARHSILHSGIKPHECPVCHKSFAMKSSLKTHLNTHRKEQPRSCDECGRAFIRQDCLIRHMRTKHRDMLEDILAGAEKKRLQQQLLAAASEAASERNPSIAESGVWSELTLTDSIKELLTLLVDEATLKAFGWPDTPVDKLLDSVIRRCGHKPASDEDFDYIGRLRENAKLLFTVVIDDTAVKTLLNNQTVDEVILHVLRLAKAE